MPNPNCGQHATFWNHANHRITVVGVDFGTLNTVIAVARNRGVDVVSTPASLQSAERKPDVSRSQMKSRTVPHRKSQKYRST